MLNTGIRMVKYSCLNFHGDRGILPQNAQRSSVALPHRPWATFSGIRSGGRQIDQKRGLVALDMHFKASNSSDISSMVNKGRVQISDVVDWFINLPWQKMASWIVVILAATQLKEFLGVCYYCTIWKIECILISPRV